MSSTFKLAPVVATLLARAPAPPLSPSSRWRPELSNKIDRLHASINIRAALHLLNDDFDGCHSLASMQGGNPYSSHLHAIVHRREPDYWNSKQWIARSTHKYMPFIYGPTPTSSVSQAQEAAEKFVDQVQAAVSSNKGIEEAEAKQWKEMTALTRLLLELERQ